MCPGALCGHTRARNEFNKRILLLMLLMQMLMLMLMILMTTQTFLTYQQPAKAAEDGQSRAVPMPSGPRST